MDNPLFFRLKLYQKKKEVYVYHPTYKNDFYCFTDEDGFGLGSDPHYGLFINSDLNKGFSFKCETYNNN